MKQNYYYFMYLMNTYLNLPLKQKMRFETLVKVST